MTITRSISASPAGDLRSSPQVRDRPPADWPATVGDIERVALRMFQEGTISVQWSHVLDKPETFDPSEHRHNVDEIDKLDERISSRISNLLSREDVVPEAIPDGVKIATIGGKEIRAPKGGDETPPDYDAVRTDAAIGATHAVRHGASGPNTDANPHGATSDDIPMAQIAGESVGSFARALLRIIEEHRVDKTNPHGTTAGQVGAYTKAEVDEKISQNAAHYLTAKVGGAFVQFATYAALAAAKDAHTDENPQFWYGDDPHTPDKNDYCIVLDDETHGHATTRYMFVGEWPDGLFRYQYTVNETALTQAQCDALNSGATKEKIDAIDGKLDKTEGVLEPGSFGLANGSGVEGFFVRKDAGIYIGTQTGIIEIPGGTMGGTMAVISDIPDVIDPATATTTGKAADAAAVKTALARLEIDGTHTEYNEDGKTSKVWSVSHVAGKVEISCVSYEYNDDETISSVTNVNTQYVRRVEYTYNADGVITDVNLCELSGGAVRNERTHYVYKDSGYEVKEIVKAADGIDAKGFYKERDGVKTYVDIADVNAILSDIADATKLTPVFSEWTLGDHTPGMLIRNISATYDETKKGWETTEELSTNGGQTWNEYTVLADENPDPDKTATSITCIYATYVRTIIGYTTANGENLMSGADDAKTALFADTALTEKITTLAEAACRYKIVTVGADGNLTDRAINATSASSVTVPEDYTDLLIRATVTGSLSVTVPEGVTKYGDAFPAESGEYLVTITKLTTGEAFVKTLKLEVANA